ncbi:hypothetical protein SLA2020_174910 [Shorea laevis]
MGRTPSCNVDGLKKGAWTAEEDEKLLAYIQKHGEGSWRSLPEKAGLQRCGKSCRLRWANYLRPGIKRGEFTLEEEETIIKLHAELGNRWATISRCLPKRTDNEIKNHWNAHLKKRLAKMGIDNPAEGSSRASSLGQPPHHQGSSASTTARFLNKLATNLSILQRIDTNLCSQSISVTTASTSTMSSFSEGVSAPSGPAVSDPAWVRRDMPSLFTTKLDFPDVSNALFSESVEGNNAGDDILSTLSNVSTTPTGLGVMNRMDPKFSSVNCNEDQLQDCETCILQEPLMEGGTSTSKTAPVEYIDDFSDNIDISAIWDCSHECDMGSPFSDDDFNFVENAMSPKDRNTP